MYLPFKCGSNVILIIGAVFYGNVERSCPRGGVAGSLNIQVGGRYSRLLVYICLQKPKIYDQVSQLRYLLLWFPQNVI